jgi:DNA (cytosine-5)-methyltransferase 1
MSIKVFDFFSGCGGTSKGFQQAGLDVRLGIDIDMDAGKTYKLNFPSAGFICDDIRNIQPKQLAEYIGERNEPLLFCGCAPCQPFSKQNRQKSENDPRINLLGEFFKFIDHWLPEYIFIENVPGLQKIKDVASTPLGNFLQKIQALGYHYDLRVFPALWFGVPQTRERLVILASKSAKISLPSPTHGVGKKPFSTVYDWIGHLSPIEAGQRDSFDKEHVAASLSPINLERIKATTEGGNRQSWPEHLKLECHKNHTGHSDVYGRLSWHKPASAMTTRCISYSNGRFGHPEQNRALSVREAACLQTFPMDYVFYGSLASKSKQIGNAVPPLMAQAVGRQIIEHEATVADLSKNNLAQIAE